MQNNQMKIEIKNLKSTITVRTNFEKLVVFFNYKRNF